MRAVASIASGRRSKWVVVLVWVIAMAVMMPLGAKLVDETEDDTASFLPESAESTEVVSILDERFEAGETTQGLIVYKRDGGLTADDKQKIVDDSELVQIAGNDEVDLTENPTVPFRPGAPPDLVSSDQSVAYTVLTTPTNFEDQGEWGKNVREIVEEEPVDGLQVLVSGDLGFSADAEEVFGELDTKLLSATVLLVLILLGLIYRAVLVALTPLLVVFFAYTVAQGFIYLMAKGGATVSSNSTSILIVLMFGVGTDYCLLLVSRYREELRALEDKHSAMQRAVSRSGPAILASGLTVSLAMLVLALADAQNTATLGPVAAIGVFCVMVAGLTLLPALLTIWGRTGFWPRRSMVAYDPEHAVQVHRGLWRRLGDRVLQTPAQALIITVLVFGAGALGVIAWKVDYSTTTFFKKSVDSVEGFEVMGEAFPQGLLFPTTLLIEREDGPVTAADAAAAQEAVQGADGVVSAAPQGSLAQTGCLADETGTDGCSDDDRAATLDVVLEGDPYTVEALDRVPGIRDSVEDLGPGLTALVGGGSAISYDFDQAVESDFKLIAPLALLVIAIILAILLRALVAPLS